MQTSVPLPQSEVFTSWKEIATYLNKGVRTVQRWEAEFGLPVRRPRERTRGIVQASRHDLDRWLTSKWAVRAINASVGAAEQKKRHHDLRVRNQELMADLAASLKKLSVECRMLHEQVESSRLQRFAQGTVNSAALSRGQRGN